MNGIVELSNGLKVANFSSAHKFTFEDGTILPEHTKERSDALSVTFVEKDITGKGDIKLDFELSNEVITEMRRWLNYHLNDIVDYVYCPLPMIQAIKRIYGEEMLLLMPFRGIRRAKRNNIKICINKRCI